MLSTVKNWLWQEETPATIPDQAPTSAAVRGMIDYTEAKNEKACFYPELVGGISMLLPAESMLCDPKFECRIWKIENKRHENKIVAMVFKEGHATSFCCQKNTEGEAIEDCIRQINASLLFTGKPKMKAINIKREV